MLGLYRLTEIVERNGKSIANLDLASIEELAIVAY